MDLVIGGAFQGKFLYACDQFQLNEDQVIDGGDCAFDQVGQAHLINHFHLLVKRLLEENMDPMEFLQKTLSDREKLVIVCNELGCGLVPIDAFDRQYRETVGRVLCRLAKEAKSVTRVYCGLGQRLK